LFYESLEPKHWHLRILTQEFILRKTPFLQLFFHTFLRNTMATLFVHGKINSRVLLRSESGWDELHGKLVLTDVLLESYWRRRNLLVRRWLIKFNPLYAENDSWEN
jgi:hypothetical protein